MIYRKLKDAGSFCIPLIWGTKKPALTLDHLGGFTGISEYGIPDDVLEDWDVRFKDQNKYGIGLILGKSSNKSVLDLDTFDADILKIIPDSVLIKKGERLGSYFYKHMPDYKSKDNWGDGTIPDAVEFLNSNMMTVIPPSVHPKTKEPYIWIGDVQSLETISENELNSLKLSDLRRIEEHYAHKYKKHLNGHGSGDYNSAELIGTWPAVMENGRLRCANGSYNRIKKKTAGIIAAYTPIEAAIKELVDYDLSAHTGLSYFQDITRGKDSKSTDIYANALRFISSMLEAINTQRKIRGEDAINLMTLPAPPPLKHIEKAEKKTLPPLSGKMKVFVDYLNGFSTGENTEIYFGAALAWLSMLPASRYCIKTKAFNTPANLMIWCVMPSGEGKDSPQNLIQYLFYGHKVMGASNYKSAPSLLMNLNNVFKEKKGQAPELVIKGQRENLILIDECSTFFRMAAGGELYQKDMIETSNTIFSRSSGFYPGDQSIKRGAGFGASYNPYFTFLGFTTINHFNDISGSRIVGNGFFERSLVFIKSKKSKFNDNPFKDEAALNELKAFTDKHLDVPVEFINYGMPIAPEKEITTEVAYRPFPITAEAEEYLHEYRKKMYNKESDDMDDSFYGRFVEIATKLALLHAISDEDSFVDLSDVKWALQTVDWCYSKARPVFENIKEKDVYKDAVQKIADKLKKEPNQMATRAHVVSKIRFYPKNTKPASFLNELIEMQMIETQSIEGKTWIKVVNPSTH